jgi:hypothetical protein
VPKPKGQNATSWLPEPEVAQRRAKLVEYRRQKRPYADFYQELGYSSVQAAARDFHRALAESIARQDTAVDVYREEQLQELEYLAEEIHAEFRRDHFLVSLTTGKIATHPETGELLRDPAPRYAAADRLLKIADQVAKLRGVYAPTKVEGVFTIDALNRALDDARDELARVVAAETEDQQAGGTGGDPG